MLASPFYLVRPIRGAHFALCDVFGMPGLEAFLAGFFGFGLWFSARSLDALLSKAYELHLVSLFG